MARIRTVKPEFFQHEELGACSFAARLLAIGLMQLADSEGRLRWVPKTIEAHVFPWDEVDLDDLASGLERAGFLLRYEVEGRAYGVLPNFRKHQRLSGKEATAASAHPAPGSTWENLAASPTLPRENPAIHAAQKAPIVASSSPVTDAVANGTAGAANARRNGEAPDRFPGKQRESQEQGTGNREQGSETSSPAGALDFSESERIHELRQALGAPLSIAPVQVVKWTGIARQPRGEVDDIVRWAVDKGERPVGAFLSCFDPDGTIKARKPTRTSSSRRGRQPYVQQQDDPRYFQPGQPVQSAESMAYLEELRKRQEEEERLGPAHLRDLRKGTK